MVSLCQKQEMANEIIVSLVPNPNKVDLSNGVTFLELSNFLLVWVSQARVFRPRKENS
jgi:hypothetical protein